MVKAFATLALGIALLLGAGCDADVGPAQMASLSQSKTLDKEKSLAVNIDYGVGEFTLSPGEPRKLYRLDLEYDENRLKPVFSYNVSDNEGRLDLQIESHKQFGGSKNRWQSRLDMGLTDAVPIDMRLKTGVSDAKIDLSGLRLRRLDIEGGVGQTSLSFTKANPIPCDRITLRSGVGEFKIVGLGNANANSLLFEGGIGATRLDLTGNWQRNSELEMRMGIGEVVLIAPQEIGIEIEGQKNFLSSLHLDGFQQVGDRHRSKNYDKAKYRLLVRIKTGIGSVRVRWA